MKPAPALLGTALLAACGVAFHFWREAESGRQQIAALTKRLQERQVQPVASATVPSIPDRVNAAASPAVAATEEPENAKPGLPPVGQDAADTLSALRSSPEEIANSNRQRRRLMEGTYPDIEEALGLTRAEAVKLLDLLVAHERNRNASRAAEGDDPAGSLDRAAALRLAQQAKDAELQALLGSRFARWREYQMTLPVWQQRVDLRAVLDAAGTPLSDTQGRALIAALVAEQRRMAQQEIDDSLRSGAVGMTQFYTPEKRQRLLGAAAGHLSPQQLEGYKGLLERLALRESMRMVR